MTWIQLSLPTILSKNVHITTFYIHTYMLYAYETIIYSLSGTLHDHLIYL